MEERPEAHHGLAEVLAPEADQTQPEGAARLEFPWADHVDTGWDAFDFTPYEKFAEIRGAKLNYVDIGVEDGPVLLFVHGIMGTWRNWIFNLLPFADRYRVIAVDLPGFGLSEMPRGQLTIAEYAATLDAFCAHMGFDKVTLIGNSMGGQVGTIFAKQYPQRLDRLMLVDAAGFSTSTKRLRRIAPFGKRIDWLFKLTAKIRRVIAGNRWLASGFTKIVLWRPMQVSSELILVLLAGVGKPGFVPALASITRTPVAKFPGKVLAETVIIWGRNDHLIPVGDAYRYARMLPDATLEIIDRTGHIPMFETPDAFNALIAKHAPEPAAIPAATAA